MSERSMHRPIVFLLPAASDPPFARRAAAREEARRFERKRRGMPKGSFGVAWVALASLGALAGCRQGATISPEGPRGSPPPGRPSAAAHAGPVAEPSSADERAPAHTGPRFALATPNAANGFIELVLSDRPTACGPHRAFPETCEPAWRVRITLSPEHQRPGEYLLGEARSPFSYRDAQGPSGGAWGAGVQCQNLGGHFDGVLSIVAIESDAIVGTLRGGGEADGPFRASRCPACKGTGLSCASNAECCNDLCETTCQP
jgi:hypothetical protein